MENTETRVWLDFLNECGYITQTEYSELDSKAEEIGKLLNHMIENPEKYIRKTKAKQ
jgi:four helix bundle protein